MTAAPSDAGIAPHSLLADLLKGHLDWNAWRDFPRPSRAEEELGDRLVAEAEEFFAQRVDPTELDDTRVLPDGLLDELQQRGYLRLVVPPELGGLGLAPYTAFRVIAQACAHSVPVGQIVAIQNGVGAAAMLPALPPAPCGSSSAGGSPPAPSRGSATPTARGRTTPARHSPPPRSTAAICCAVKSSSPATVPSPT
ncbi:acyl-CoA dehydrogenase family protein [Streptomyces diastatochromogenes]|nr:acyl-CoA dehydrogenase family protein [Streptomyces diastatochromogenes]